mmetsp:Transcript_39253/g.108150  ORF Transcript_39253/g.108150 Transcript_39253/m.108150 type:complete len:494 (-) Transcript_39253:242-1723(-)
MAEASPSSSVGSPVGRKAANGFYSLPEPEAITVSEENIARLSLPQQALTYEPPEDLVVYKFKNGDKERKIHCHTELTEVELKQLSDMQREAIRQNLAFFPSVSVMATRYLSRARGDVKKALQLMTSTQEWRTKYFGSGPISDKSIEEDLGHGIVYFVGRDCGLRPTLVCRANRIPQTWYKEKQTDKLIRVLIFCMEYMIRFMLVPGRVEGNNLVVDLKGLSASQVPLKELSKLYSIMSSHYVGRVFKFYIINLSTMLSLIASAATGLLTDRQKQKMNILSNVKVMASDFALHQLEEDHGGSTKMYESFFPFPLQSGPFEAGDASGPEPDAVPRVDKVFTSQTCRGRLWDTKRSREENLEPVYALEAAEVFKQCNLPLPKLLEEKVQRAQRAAELRASKVSEKNGVSTPSTPRNAEVADTPASCLPTSPSNPLAVEIVKDNLTVFPPLSHLDMNPEDSKSDIIYGPGPVEVSEVSPSGSWFSCHCCTSSRQADE